MKWLVGHKFCTLFHKSNWKKWKETILFYGITRAQYTISALLPYIPLLKIKFHGQNRNRSWGKGLTFGISDDFYTWPCPLAINVTHGMYMTAKTACQTGWVWVVMWRGSWIILSKSTVYCKFPMQPLPVCSYETFSMGDVGWPINTRNSSTVQYNNVI